MTSKTHIRENRDSNGLNEFVSQSLCNYSYLPNTKDAAKHENQQ